MHEHYSRVGSTDVGQTMTPEPGEESAHSPHPPQVSRTLPDHLIALEDSDWALWRWSTLRGAGFPVDHVLSLANPTFAATVDHFLHRDNTAERLHQSLLAVLAHNISKMPLEERKEPFKVLRRTKKGPLAILPAELPPAAQAPLHDFRAAHEAKEQDRAVVQAQFEPVMAQIYQSVYETTCDERFREAVTWQDQQAMRNGVDAYRRRMERTANATPLTKDREHALLIVKYLQRYCAKNDSIGFFGPVGWARWSPNCEAALDARPGPSLLARRTVYFETWAIDTLGEVLARTPEMLPFAVPRPMPFLHLDGDILHMPFVKPITLAHEQAVVLAACDGKRTASEVAQIVTAHHASTKLSEAEVFAILHHLRALRRIYWGFEVSMEEVYPERMLRQQIERIESQPARTEALAMLNQLEQARDVVAQALGHAEQLDAALASLDETFTTITSVNPTREAGKVYAARTLVYEDCQRDIEMTLGPPLLEALQRPLALLLKSARWFTYAAANLYRDAFRDAYSSLVDQHGSASVDLATFWPWVQHLISIDPAERLINGLTGEFQQRWESILNVEQGERHVRYSSEQLSQRVQELFDAPHAGWRSACYHSPDLMIDATSIEAIQRDDYQFILGEFHLGLNTLDVIALAHQHPDIAQLQEATRIDLPEPRIIPVFPRHVLPAKRTHAMLALPKDWRFVFGVDGAGVPLERLLRTGDLVILDVAGTLVARTRDGRQQFDLLEIFEGLCSLQVCDTFKMLTPRSHTPRVTIDRLVVCRESWRFAPSELSFAFHKDHLACYVEARRWALRHELPRFLFFRTPLERKPYYLDLASPMYVEMFAKTIRQTKAAQLPDAWIGVSEMLPDPDHAWLPDAAGKRYTCEIRVAAVDQRKKTEGTSTL